MATSRIPEGFPIEVDPPVPIRPPVITREKGVQLIEAIDAREKAKEQVIVAQHAYDEQNRRLYRLIHELQGEY